MEHIEQLACILIELNAKCVIANYVYRNMNQYEHITKLDDSPLSCALDNIMNDVSKLAKSLETFFNDADNASIFPE